MKVYDNNMCFMMFYFFDEGAEVCGEGLLT